MSRRALLVATRDVLRLAPPTGLGFANSQCDLTGPEGKPPPICGKRFIAVHRGPRRSGSKDDLDEYYDYFVTVTMRINEPFDRIGTDLIELASTGMDEVVDAIRALLHSSYEVMNRANTIIGVLANGFVEPAFYLGDQEAMVVGGDWFHAQPEAVESGIVVHMRFGDARRIQYIGSAT